jgi:hypothetical protein
MANIRTLKLNLLADTTDFAAGIKKASGQTDSFSTNLKSSMKSIAKSAALAGVAVAGMAVAFGVDAVKAAIEDQKSQKQLQVALKNTTKATDKQIKSAEKWITKQQFAYGIADDKLRPALARLTRATGDVTKAQDLLSIAIDVSAGTGKDLQTVTDAIAKAQTGNLGSLKKLGVPLTENIIKTKDLTAANELMAKSYGGAAAANADTLAGKLAIFNQRIGEAKESIGTAILKAIQPFAEKWLPKIATLVTDVIDGFLGKKGKGEGISLGKAIKDVTTAIGGFIAAFNANDDGKQRTFAENISALAKALELVAGAINKVTSAFGKLKAFENSPIFEKVLSKIPLFYGLQIAKKEQEFFFGNNNNPPKKALGGPVSKGKSYLVGEHGPELFTPMGGGTISPNGRLNGGNVTIIMNGVIDGESARRSIERVLQQSSIRTGAVNVNGVAL